MRRCPFQPCHRRVPPRKFCCYRHWMALAPDHRSEADDIINDLVNGDISRSQAGRRMAKLARFCLEANPR